MANCAASRIADQARAMLGADVSVVAVDPDRVTEGLHTAEAAATAAMVKRRRREYLAGRVAARRAMAELGLPGRPVIAGPDRAPIWPEGIVGSITHTETCCLAVAARQQHVQAIGIDLEPDEDLPEMLHETVLLPDELRWTANWPAKERGRLARLVFTAKEAAYKCQYPLTRTIFGFDGMCVRLDLAGGSFVATFTSAVGAFGAGHALHGRFAFGADHILACVSLHPIGTVSCSSPDPLEAGQRPMRMVNCDHAMAAARR